MRKCLFGHSPSSVWKPLRVFIWKWRKRSARKIIARAVYKKWKTLFWPSGCIVPSLEMSCISNCFRLKLAPEHLLRPLTAMSDRLWPGEFKCSATRKPPVFFECSEDVRRNVHVEFDRSLWCKAGGIDGTRCSIQCSLICRWSIHEW